MAISANVHPSRRSNVSSTPSQGVKKKKTGKSSLKSASGLRTKIRDIARQLDRAQTMPANIRVDKERELAGYKGDLEKLEEQNHRKKIIGKYHMVRFFEKQKATRALKKLQKAAAALSPTSPEIGDMQQAVHEAEVDLNYTIYCPLAERYHSLYPRQKGITENDPDHDMSADEAKEKTPQGPKPPLWVVVENAMSDGTLEALRDGRTNQKVSKLAVANRKARRQELAKQDALRKAEGTRSNGGFKTAPDDDAEGNISDGGFFEE